MKARTLFIGLVTLALLIVANLVFAGIPQQMNYQGRLTNDSGTPVGDGNYTMIFRIYDVATGGSPLWNETDTVSVEGGLFNVILGLKTPIDLPFDEDYWLGIQVGTDSEMTPRHKLTSVGYGYKAENSDMVNGLHASSTPTAGWLYPLDGSAKIPNDRLYTGSGMGLDADMVDGQHASAFVSQGQANSITSGMIVDGTITAADIGPSIVSSIDGVNNDGGNIDLVAGDNITITPDDPNNRITISASSGGGGDITAVYADNGLTGGATSGDAHLNVGAGTGISVSADVVALNTSYTDGRYVNEGQSNSVTSGMISNNTIVDADISSSANIQPSKISGTAWTSYNDGSGSGLDADKLDGQHASAFLSTSNDYGRYNVASDLYEGTKEVFSWNDVVGVSSSRSGIGLKLRSLDSHAFAGFTHASSSSPEYAAIRGENDRTSSVGALGVYNIGVYGGAGSGTYAGKFDGPVEIVCTSSSYDGIASQTSQSGRSAVTGKNSSYNTWGGLGYRNYGVWGYQGSGARAGYFDGDVTVTGHLTKGSGSFKIDHPLDPANKYLYHSFVESPDMMNVYNGNALLDANGEAVVELPDYFEALNKDFRYQLTAVGAPGPNLYVAEKITSNHFKIAGGKPGMEVSWQITGIRKDPYAEANRIQVEVNKPPAERGKYLHPKAYGLGPEYGISHGDQKWVKK